MKNITCCFTGHRNIPHSEYGTLQKHLETELVSLINQGVIYFGAGGALGFDTMAAQTVLKLKQKYPYIRLILVLPCREQAKNWNLCDIKKYNQILKNADKIVFTSEHYYAGCMHKRNRHLVNNSNFCLCYLNKSSGGTAYTVNYAKKAGLKIINLSQPRADDITYNRL